MTHTSTEQELEKEARRMYDDCPTIKPSWDQIGDVTRSVWRQRAAEKLNNAAHCITQEQE